MHLSETRINDYIDDVLDSDERAAVAQHLEACPPCRNEVETLRALMQRVGELPVSIHPDRDLRADIWRQVDRPSLWHWRYPLAAAAILLIAISSVITVLVTRDRSQPVVRATEAQPSTVDLVNLESQYSSEVTALQETLREHRDQLAPETVRILEENLRIIDNAIQEARSALANDPQSGMLAELLRSAYQRKLDLLKQVARSTAAT
jgi:anti-sigma factor RsiW